MTDGPAPEEIHNVRHTHLSIARHFGGATVNGHAYVYNPVRDVLVRADVLRRREAEAADLLRAARKRAAEAQGTLWTGPADPGTPEWTGPAKEE